MPVPTAEQRKRVGLAVEVRIAGLRTTATAVARRAGVDPRTVQGLINGTSWPKAATRARISEALDWPAGELVRRATTSLTGLEAFSTRDLMVELWGRMDAAGL